MAGSSRRPALAPPRGAALRPARERARRRLQRAALARALAFADELVVDLDNTLFDTRPRTLRAIEVFVARQRSALSPGQRRRLAAARIGDVDFDPRSTAARLGLRGAEVGAFAGVWDEVFWAPESLALDRPIRETFALVRDAAARGKPVHYLTGRNDGAYRAATLAQLRDRKLPLPSEDRLVTRPKATATPAFKRGWLARRSIGRSILFLDDSASTVAGAAGLRGVTSVLVDFAVHEPGWRRLPGVRLLRLRPDRSATLSR